MMNPAFLSSIVRRPGRGHAPAAGSLLLGAACLLSGVHGACAEEAAPTPDKVSGKEYVLTKSSSFKAPPGDTRNPFWPIGWTPGPVVPATQAAMVYEVKPENFALSTTSLDSPPLAIINGRSYTVRDQIPTAPGNTDFVTVKSIQDGSVVLDHHGRELRIVAGSASPRPKK